MYEWGRDYYFEVCVSNDGSEIRELKVGIWNYEG
jgi:hypothetical protein